MSAFPLTSELTVNIFRTEPHLCDAAGLLGPLWGQTQHLHKQKCGSASAAAYRKRLMSTASLCVCSTSFDLCV